MRSVIYEANEEGIRDIVNQQFEFAKTICDGGLVPIIEPEVDIYSEQKRTLRKNIKRRNNKKTKRMESSRQNNVQIYNTNSCKPLLRFI